MIFGLLLFCLVSFGHVTAEGKSQTGLSTQELSIVAASGKQVPIIVEIAKTDDEKETGLMWRKSLATGRGMLFVYDRDGPLSFWMKNTLIPLSIAYIASDGRIINIFDMEAKSLKAVRSTRSARYALEVPQGWFGREGIVVGDKVTGI
jgi:uncharacterized membrane protein (UPF0127 family)